MNLEILEKSKKYILAFSAGPDSVYLLHKLLSEGYTDLVVCYFDHNLRDESKDEIEFVKNLCKQKNLDYDVGEAKILEIQKNSPSASMEEIARVERYKWLRSMKKKYKCKYIITAHHLDDKIETFFLNMLRGSKLSGLINMDYKSGDILRPLLDTPKKDILNYLDENSIDYKIDKSNSDNTIKRNYLRNEIIPRFEKINSSYKTNISNLLDYFSELKNYIDSEVENFLGDKNYFVIEEFNSKSGLIQNEIIRYIYYTSNSGSTIGLSEANIKEIKKFINGKNNKTVKQINGLNMRKDNRKIYY